MEAHHWMNQRMHTGQNNLAQLILRPILIIILQLTTLPLMGLYLLINTEMDTNCSHTKSFLTDSMGLHSYWDLDHSRVMVYKLGAPLNTCSEVFL